MTPGKFHRPKPAGDLNIFDAFAATQGKDRSAILKANPAMTHRKHGPAKPNQPFEANYNRVNTYSKAGVA